MVLVLFDMSEGSAKLAPDLEAPLLHTLAGTIHVRVWVESPSRRGAREGVWRHSRPLCPAPLTNPGRRPHTTAR